MKRGYQVKQLFFLIPLLFFFGFFPGTKKSTSISPPTKTNFDTPRHSARTLIFQNKDTASVKIYQQDEDIITVTNSITYREENFLKNDTIVNCLVKETQTEEHIDGMDDHNSQISLNIYEIGNPTLLKTVTKSADEVLFPNNDFIETISDYDELGSYGELSTIWTDETFLRFYDKYYIIEVPNTHNSFYLGFNYSNDTGMVLGEIYFTQALGTLKPGAEYYSTTYKNTNKLILRTNNATLYNDNTFEPELTLVKHAKEDAISVNENYDLLELWSFNEMRGGLKNLNFTALKIKCYGEPADSVEIPVINGFLYGDSTHYEKTIYIGK